MEERREKNSFCGNHTKKRLCSHSSAFDRRNIFFLAANFFFLIFVPLCNSSTILSFLFPFDRFSKNNFSRPKKFLCAIFQTHHHHHHCHEIYFFYFFVKSNIRSSKWMMDLIVGSFDIPVMQVYKK
ncbi:hypothetical protein ACKWTF_007958 [Chironomus riparius]